MPAFSDWYKTVSTAIVMIINIGKMKNQMPIPI